ncbi:hypothetical protein [Allopontixanthobacter confluentis]|nr:hypothetical protein [Allopontixanthobacter confluentis]
MEKVSQLIQLAMFMRRQNRTHHRAFALPMQFVELGLPPVEAG